MYISKVKSGMPTRVLYIHTYIHTCLSLLISMLWHRQAIFESKGDKVSSSAECRIRTQGLRHLFASRLNACWQTDWAIEDQAKKTWTRQLVPMISKHSAHSTSLPFGFRINSHGLGQSGYIRRCLIMYICIYTHVGHFQNNTPQYMTPVRYLNEREVQK